MELQDIWINSLEDNQGADISGVLYFDGGFILQLLEGDDHQISSLFNRIKRDKRHRNIRVLARNYLASSTLRKAGMKFVDVSRSEALRAKLQYDSLNEADPNEINKVIFKLYNM